jgi:hypothetical protein
MFDKILLEIFKFIGFLSIAGALALLAYYLWWSTFLISKRGKLFMKFLFDHRESYIDWLEENEEWGELERMKDRLELEEQDDL